MFRKMSIERKGESKAILMSYEEFESWLETLDILTDAEWIKALDQAKREAKKGKFLSFEKVVGRKQKRVKFIPRSEGRGNKLQ